MIEEGIFLPGDLHVHTYLSDGSHTLEDVLENAFCKYNLAWILISDHGGSFKRDPYGNLLSEINPDIIRGELYGRKGYMWRSQSILEFGEPLIAKMQKHYENWLVLHGFELNVPPRGHASVTILDSAEDLAKFAYIFDASDHDHSIVNWPKHNQTEEDALKAVEYLQKNYPDSSFFIFNHPSAYKAFTPRIIRNLHAQAEDVVNGFEGMPGHQYRPVRGSYMYEKGNDWQLHRTYGGADYMLAKVGGLWDSLLGEGRRFFVFGNSDFHQAGSEYDPYPGEYTKTYLYFREFTRKELVQSIKKGRSFVVTGDLIEDLHFSLRTDNSLASLGESLETEKPLVKLKVKLKANRERKPHHIDLIGGRVGKRYHKEDSLYDSDTNPTTEILLRIKLSEMRELSDGYYEYEKEIKLPFESGYFRLRGTNNPPNTPYETDKEGNPLIDDLPYRPNNKEVALRDLWFYSNPIFYKLK